METSQQRSGGELKLGAQTSPASKLAVFGMLLGACLIVDFAFVALAVRFSDFVTAVLPWLAGAVAVAIALHTFRTTLRQLRGVDQLQRIGDLS